MVFMTLDLMGDDRFFFARVRRCIFLKPRAGSAPDAAVRQRPGLETPPRWRSFAGRRRLAVLARFRPPETIRRTQIDAPSGSSLFNWNAHDSTRSSKGVAKTSSWSPIRRRETGREPTILPRRCRFRDRENFFAEWLIAFFGTKFHPSGAPLAPATRRESVASRPIFWSRKQHRGDFSRQTKLDGRAVASGAGLSLSASDLRFRTMATLTTRYKVWFRRRYVAS